MGKFKLNKEKVKEYTLDAGPKVQVIWAAALIVLFILVTVLATFIGSSTGKKEADTYASFVISQYGKDIGRDILEAEKDRSNAYAKEYLELYHPVKAEYSNQKTVSVSLNSGDVLQVGVVSERNDALVLDPKVKGNEYHAGHSFGIYMNSTRGTLVTPQEEIIEEYLPGTTYLFTQRTWEHGILAENIFWIDDYVIPGTTYSGPIFTFRVVDIDMRQIVGVAACSVSWDGKTFTLKELTNADALKSGELTKEQYKAYVKTACDFMTKRNVLSLDGFIESPDILSDLAVVQIAEKPYFEIMLDENGKYIRSQTIHYFDPIAVSFPSLLGPVTVYIVRTEDYTTAHVNDGDDGSGAVLNSMPSFFAFGYDLLCPFNEDSLILLPSLSTVCGQLQNRTH